jgi:hypothetical protein
VVVFDLVIHTALTVVDPDDPTEVYWQLATGRRAEVLVR